MAYTLLTVLRGDTFRGPVLPAAQHKVVRMGFGSGSVLHGSSSPDEQLKALASLVPHVLHAARMVGWRHVVLGADVIVPARYSSEFREALQNLSSLADIPIAGVRTAPTHPKASSQMASWVRTLQWISSTLDVDWTALLLLRADLLLKARMPLPAPPLPVAPEGGMILFAPFRISGAFGATTPGNHARVADTFLLVPREASALLTACLREKSSRGQYAPNLHGLGDVCPSAEIRMMLTSQHDSDSSKQWNPLYRMIGRPEAAPPIASVPPRRLSFEVAPLIVARSNAAAWLAERANASGQIRHVAAYNGSFRTAVMLRAVCAERTRRRGTVNVQPDLRISSGGTHQVLAGVRSHTLYERRHDRPPADAALLPGRSYYLFGGHGEIVHKYASDRSCQVGHFLHDDLWGIMAAAELQRESEQRDGGSDGARRASLYIVADLYNGCNSNAHVTTILHIAADALGLTLVDARNASSVCLDEAVFTTNTDMVHFGDAPPGCHCCFSLRSPTHGLQRVHTYDRGVRGPPLALAARLWDRFRGLAYLRAGLSAAAAVAEGRPAGSEVRGAIVIGRELADDRRLLNASSVYAVVDAALPPSATRFFGDAVTQLPFAKLVAALHATDVFISPHGTSIPSNVIFMRRGAVLLELYPFRSGWRGRTPKERQPCEAWQSNWSHAPSREHVVECSQSWFGGIQLTAALGLQYDCWHVKGVPARNSKRGDTTVHLNIELCLPCLAAWMARVVGALTGRE